MKCSHGPRRIVLALASWSAVLVSAACLTADDHAASASARFRRIYVPSDRIEDLPLALRHIVPIDAQRFEQLVQRAGRSRGSISTAIENVRYTAGLAGDDLLQGRAALQIRHDGDPVILPLGPCDAAVRQAVWRRGDSTVPARLGSDAAERLVVLVDQPGRLEFEWSLRGRPDAGGNLHFPLRLPTVPQNQFDLQLPAKVAANVTGAVVTSVDVTEQRRRWTINWPPAGGAELVLAWPAGAKSQRSSFLRQNDQYSISLNGLEVISTLSLDVQRESMKQLQLRLDDALRLVDVRLGSKRIPWSELEQDTRPGRLVRLQFPQPLVGSQRAIVVRALAPLTTQQPWRMPRIRPQSVVWLEGKTSLLVYEPLNLSSVNVDRGLLSKVESLPGSRGGESLEFQFYSPDAGIDIVLTNKSARLSVDMATSVEIAEQILNAQVVVDATTDEGSLYSLQGTLGVGWRITSVASGAESSQTEGAVQWEQEGRDVSIWLPQGLSPQRPLQLSIRAVKSHVPTATQVRSEQLRVLTLHGADRDRQLSHLWTARPFRLSAVGDAGSRVEDAVSLSVEDRQRLGLRDPAGLWWRNRPGQNERVIAIHRESPEYRVENNVTIQIGAEQLGYLYRIACQPQSRPVDRLVVHFTESSGVADDWSLAGFEGVKISKRRLDEVERRGFQIGKGGETWELSWNRAMRDAFQLMGRCEVAWDQVHAVSLIAVPTAAEQTGVLTVRGSDRVSLELRRDGLQPLPIPLQPWDAFASVRGFYRYDPLRETVTAKPALVMAATGASSANPRAVVWRRTTALRITRDAHAAHRTIFEVENHGARRMAVLFPQGGIEIQQATIDDQPVATLLAEEGRRMLVRLPASRRFVTVAVDYSLPRAAAGLSWLHRVNYLPLDTDFPILTSRRWLYAPGGFAVVDSLDDGPFAKPLSWRERLFGVLARRADQKIFDPFRPATWPFFSRAMNEKPVSETATPPAPIPWNVEQDSVEGTAEAMEWSVTAAEAGAGFGNRVYLVDQRRLQALAWAIGLAMAVATWFWWPGRWTTRLALVALPAVAALLLPGLVAPLATAALAGVMVTMFARLLSYGLSLFLPGRSLDGTGTGVADEAGTQKTVVETGSSTFHKIGGFAPPAGILLFAVLVLRLVVVSAQDRPAVPQATAIHPVYIPIDKDRKPSGDIYYVPQALLDLLHQARGGWPQGQAGWMVSHATYAGNLQWVESRNRQAVTNLTATYDLDVYQRRTEVRLALGNTAWKPDVGRLTLNGKPAKANWDGDGNQLVVQVDDVGAHQLVVPLTPAAGVVAATRQLDMPIPPVATAQLVLAVADNVPAIEVPSAWGEVVHDQAQGRLTAELGLTKRLALNWRTDGRAEETDSLDVDQLVVLDLQPGAVVVRAKLKLNTNEGKIRQLRLALDPELGPLPIKPPANGVDGVGYEFVQTISGDPQQMVLQFDRVVSGRQTVELAFFVRDAVGVGNVRLPYLEVPAARTSRHWVVVSADGALRIDVNDVLPHPALVAVERDALVEEWELADTNAVLSYRQTQAKVDCIFPIKPQTPTTKGTQRLSLSYGERDVQLRLDADVNTRGGYLFQHQIEVPAGLKVERVAVRGTAEQLVRRWIQDKQQLSVFLSGPVSGAHQLQVFGQMPRGGDVEQAPTLQLRNVQWNESELAVYRRDAVLVKIDKTTNLASVAEPSDAALPGSFGRLVDVFRRTDTDATCRVVVQPNDPQVQAIQAIRMVRRQDEWLAALDLRMAVRSGKVDSLTFDIPTAWEGPFEIEPVEPFEVQRSANGKTAAIIVRPREAITDQYRLQIRGRLVQGVGNRVVTPDVRLRNAADVQRFVILPKLVGGREVEWEKTGLEPQGLPAAADQPPPANTVWESYRIAAPVHGATLRTGGRRPQSAKVRLSNIYVAASPDGRHLGLAQFDVDPAGESKFWLQMPDDKFQLAQGRIGDSVLPMTFGKSGKWRLPILSQSLPQRIEILFVAQNDRRAGGQQFKAPRLLGARGPLPVERTMWTIIGGSETTAEFGENDKAELVTAWDLEVFRFERTVDMLNDVVTDDPADVLVHWYGRWSTRLDEAYRKIEGQAAVATGREVKLRQIDRQRAHFRRLARLGTSAAGGESIQQSRFFADQVLSNLSAPDARVRRLAFDGWQGEVLVGLSGRRSGLFLRLLAAAGVAGLCVVAGWLTGGGRRMLSERELLAAAVFVAGLVVWLWISPSILGLVFIVIAAVLMWPDDWKRVAA